LPKLMKFYEEHEKDRDKFEIIAFHDARASSIEDMEKKLKDRGIVEKKWGGKDLPFPVLIDSTGETIKAYGISAFPTMVLIDPKGNLVGKSNERELLKKIMEEPPEKKQKAY